MGAATVVAIAAVVSGVRSSGDDSTAATTATSEATVTTATSTTAAIPVGDLRRLPAPQPGAYTGRLVAFDALTCLPTKIALATMTSEDTTAPPTCNIWPAPDGKTVARTGPPELEEVMVASSAEKPGIDTRLTYAPGTRGGALTVTDDGGVAVCDDTSVRLSRDGRVQTLLSFTPVEGGLFEERCITGALGTRVVRLGDDRRTLVDLRTRRVVRRLAEKVGAPLVGLVASPDGLVMAIDIADGTPQGVVFTKDGTVAVPRLPVGTATRFRKLVLSRGGGAVAILTARGWQITNLRTGLNITAPGGARITDVAFSPAGDEFVATTDVGILFAAIRGLEPTALLPGTFQGVAWLP